MSVPSHAVCYIVGAGPVDPRLRLSPGPEDLLIAADGGLPAVEAMGLVPHLVIGDFDSLGHAPSHPNTVTLPCEKDITDMHAAVEQGLERGYARFALYGGTGGRLAHTLANLQVLDYLAGKGCRGFVVGDGTVATAVRDGALAFPAHMSGYLSLFCNSGVAEGITLTGLKYTLTDAPLSGSFPMGVSNEFIGVPARVSVTHGCLLALWQGCDVQPELLRNL
ncbi:MAG: thiamine diphosphokinase [Oscillospiraceae bacterium]|nr:thiamine diphosphokinase [Oscillospiraceae bacterium]